jgi:hypothetical protein
LSLFLLLAVREAMDPEAVSSTIRSATNKATGSIDGKRHHCPFYLGSVVLSIQLYKK